MGQLMPIVSQAVGKSTRSEPLAKDLAYRSHMMTQVYQIRGLGERLCISLAHDDDPHTHTHTRFLVVQRWGEGRGVSFSEVRQRKWELLLGQLMPILSQAVAKSTRSEALVKDFAYRSHMMTQVYQIRAFG